MKTIRFKRVLACTLTLLLFFSNVSAAFSIQSFAASDDVLTFRPIQNGNAYAVKYCDDSAKGTIIIPRTHNGKPVMRIDAYAFANCNDIEKIQIPDSITVIGNDVFTAMSSLEEINVESGNTTFNSDNGILYDNSMESLIKYPEGRKQTVFNIPNGVKKIKEDAIRSNNLKEIVIASSVVDIEQFVFDCDALEQFSVSSDSKHFRSVDGVLFNRTVSELIAYPIGNSRESYTIPNTVTKVWPSAFFFCDLKEIVLPNNMTHISNGAFYCCSDLTNLIIPDSVTSIGNNAFASCSSLTSIVIPNSVTVIGDGAFEDCDSVTNITIPDSVKSIGDYAFARCEQLNSVTIPDKTERVGAGAFWRCFGLTSVRVGNDVTQIGKYAFQYCRNLSTVTLGKKVTYIDDYAFDSCLALKEVQLPDSLISIGKEAFSNCRNVTQFSIPKDVDYIGDAAFSSCDALAKFVVATENNAYVGIDGVLFTKDQKELLQYPIGKESKTYTVPNGVQRIGDWAFTGCESLENFIIPDTVISIGYVAFDSTAWHNNQPTGLIYAGKVAYGFNTSDEANEAPITIKDGTKGIADSAFMYNENCKNVVLPDSLVNIDNAAFYGSGLTTITIPAGVTHIGTEAFAHCSQMKSIIVADENAYYQSPDGVLLTKDGSILIQYPLAKEDSCYSIPKNVLRVEDVAFDGCSSLTRIVFSDNIRTIGEYAFAYCKFTEIVLPSGITTLEDGSFNECTELKTLKMPKSIKTIGAGAFRQCTALSDVYYGGTQIEKEQLRIDGTNNEIADNSSLFNATWHYNYVSGMNTVISNTTNIQMEYADGVFSGNVVLETEAVLSGSAFTIANNFDGSSKTFSIWTLVDSVETQPNGTVTVRIPLPAGYTSVDLYYVNIEKQQMEKIPSRIEDGWVVFETTHFSYYSIVNKDSSVKVALDQHDVALKYKGTSVLYATVPSGLSLAWTSSNEKVAKVDQSGKVTAVGKGSATITCAVTNASGETASDHCTVTVTYTWWQWLIRILLFGWIWY